MKGRERNTAFFQQNRNIRSDRSAENNVKTLLKNGRSTGSVVLSEKKLQEIPAALFSVEQDLEDGEKFWEVQPVVKIDLSNNEIGMIPDDIARLTNMTNLKIRNNKLHTISDALYACISLTHLDLSSNSLTCLSDAIGSLLVLTELQISCNALKTLPESLSQCSRLLVIDACENQLEYLPSNIGQLRCLTRLNLGSNKLAELPISFDRLTTLQDLHIKKNKLEILPSFANMSALVVFDASENKISEFPTFPPRDRNVLARLYLAGNRLNGISSAALGCGENSLVELDIQGNLLSELSMDIGLLQKLKLLNASNNNLTDLPYTLGYMSALQRIVLDGNPLRTIRRSLLSQSTNDLKKYLRTRGPEPDYVKKQEQAFHFADINPIDERLRDLSGGVLNCSGLELSVLPSDFASKLFRATSIDSTETTLRLIHINLSNNKLICIPGELMEIDSLQILDLSNNILGSLLPERMMEQVSMFPLSIRVLNVNKNGLSADHVNVLLRALAPTVPQKEPSGQSRHQGRSAGIVTVSSVGLQSFLCSENKLTQWPNVLYSVSETLRELQLSYNLLTNFSNVDFRPFQRLEIIDLSNNKLRSLGNLYNCVNLSDVLVTNNDLSDVPLEFGRLTKMRNFSLMGNPQKTVRLHVVQQGTEEILKVLRLRLPEESTALDGKVNTSFSNPATTPGSEPLSSYQHQPGKEINFQIERNRQFQQKSTGAPARDVHYPPVPERNTAFSHSLLPPPAAAQPRGQLMECESSDARDPVGRQASSSSSYSQKDSYATTGSAQIRSSDIDSKIRLLETQLQELSCSMDSPGVSETKRFALKKDMAKIRANILRLNRERDSR